MIETSEIEKCVEEYLSSCEGLFIVSAEVHPGNLIRVVIDADEQLISLDTITDLSHFIEQHFDREAEDYELTVMSAGLTSPLLLPRQYRKYIGEPMIVRLRDGGMEKGTLTAADEEGFDLEVLRMEKREGDKRRKAYPTPLHFTYDDTKSVVYDLKV